MAYDLQECPVRRALEALGGKWTLLLLHELRSQEPMRFAVLRRAIGSISEKMLTQELRALEANGLIDRRDHQELPPRVDYTLTDQGVRALAVVEALAQFGLGLPRSAGMDVIELPEGSAQLSSGAGALAKPLVVA